MCEEKKGMMGKAIWETRAMSLYLKRSVFLSVLTDVLKSTTSLLWNNAGPLLKGISFGTFPVINLRSRFTALQLQNCVRDDYPREISALDLLGVLPNIWLLTKGFKVTKQWLFRRIFFREMYLVMHGVEGECWDSFFWLHSGFSTLSLWDVFLCMGYQEVGDESASIPQSFWFWLTLCSVFSIYRFQKSGELNLKVFLIWKKVCACMTLLPLVWFLSSGLDTGVYAQILSK